MTQAQLGEKYNLTPARLSRLLHQLVAMKALDAHELDSLLPGSKEPEAQRLEEDPDPSFAPSPTELEHPEWKAPHDSPDSGPFRDDERQAVGGGYFLGDSPQTGSGAQGALWSLKLYGKTTRDRSAFCGDLAAVLGIDYREAEDYYDKAPVTVKLGLTKDKAERLRSVLASIGAMCLAEEHQAENVPNSRAEHDFEFAPFFRRDQRPESSSLLPSSVKASTIVLTVLVLVLSVFGWHLMRITAPVREFQATAGSITKKKLEQDNAVPVVALYQPYSQDDLSRDADRVEAEARQIQFRLQIERDAYKALEKSPYGRSKFQSIFEKNLEIKALEKKLDEKLNDLRRIQKRINFLNGSEAAVQPNE